MGWFRRIVSEVAFGLSLFGASVAGIDPRLIVRSGSAGGPSPAGGPSGGGRPSPCGADVPGPPDVVPQPPPGHPERLVPHQPLTDEERRIWSQLR